jgi:multisubunit Na+/H+ antiporter MnhC subunit
MRSKSNFTAYLLIALGIYFLLSKLNLIPNLIPMLFDWWPVILIVIGVSMLVRRASRDGS